LKGCINGEHQTYQRSQKAEHLKEPNSLTSVLKTIALLFGNNPEAFSQQQKSNTKKQTKLKKALAITDKLLSELEQEQAVSEGQAWQPLYA
jgi:hypothetical protein